MKAGRPMYFERQALRFACTGCGRCCTGDRDHYVEVRPEEQRRIQQLLGVSRRWFRGRYLMRLADGSESLRLDGNGRCVFLDAASRCRIYGARPAQCRHYPFWPELVTRQSAWTAEGRRCEGIGRGEAVPLEKLRRLLRRQRTA